MSILNKNDITQETNEATRVAREERQSLIRTILHWKPSDERIAEEMSASILNKNDITLELGGIVRDGEYHSVNP